jgi:hypothetical protein
MKRGSWLAAIGSICALMGLYLTYIYTGADGLRTEVYEPLYQEVSTVQQSLPWNSLDKEIPSNVFDNLNRSGKALRIPKSLRLKLQQVYSKSLAARAHVSPLTRKIEILVPDYIRGIRTERDDKVWSAKTVEQLNRQMDLRGLGGVYFQLQFSHSGHSIAIDRRDPAHPRVAQPASLTWEINDWISFPHSAVELERGWPDQPAYLEFDPRNETWMYRITREDLTRKHLGLQQFLQPIYVKLAADPDFQLLVSIENEVLKPLKDVNQMLAERVDQPKRLRDLVDY